MDADQVKEIEKGEKTMGCRTETEDDKKGGERPSHKNREKRRGTGEGKTEKFAAAWEREGARGETGRDQDAQEGRQGPQDSPQLSLWGLLGEFDRSFFPHLSSLPLQ